jgi:hypothetical protein
MKISERQSKTNPTVGDTVPELLTPFTSVENGIFPVALTAPKIHKNNPGHPQSRAVAIVAIMPVFLLFIDDSPLKRI